MPGSVNAAVRRLAPEAHAVVVEIAPGGIVGRHPTRSPQLYVVVKGSGWVSGGDAERVPIQAGEAVLWELGEEHESDSDEGMTALIVEAESLDL